MCVAAIVLPGGKAPTLKQLENMERQNPDGAGVAWPQRQGDQIVVAWEKGLHMSAERVHNRLTSLLKEGVGPILFHFRYSTVGGKNSLLCHPFPVEEFPELTTEGTAPEVLIHNGHWSEWDSLMALNAELFQRADIDPKDKRQVWSDTRCGTHLIAMGLIHQKDITGKVAILQGSTMEVFRTGSWELDKDHDIWYSNRFWDRVHYSTVYQGPTTHTSRKKGSSVYDKDDWDYGEWWEGYLARKEEAANEQSNQCALVAKKEKDVVGEIVERYSMKQCFLCDHYGCQYRKITEEDWGGTMDDEYWVCPKCDWLTEEPAKEPANNSSARNNPNAPVDRLFTREEVEAGLRAAHGLSPKAKLAGLGMSEPKGTFTNQGFYNGEIRYINGVPHWQAKTGEWCPMEK